MSTEESVPQQEPVPIVDKDGKVLGALRGLFPDSRDLVVESGTNSLSPSVKRDMFWGKLMPAFTQICDQTALNIICL